MEKHLNRKKLTLLDAKSPGNLALIRTICENHQEKISTYQALAILKFLQEFAELIITQEFDS